MPRSGNLLLRCRLGRPVKPYSRCVVHDQKIPSSARIPTIRPPWREDFALSPEIGQSAARFQAHTLWLTATGTPSQPNSATSFTAPIRKKVPTMKSSDDHMSVHTSGSTGPPKTIQLKKEHMVISAKIGLRFETLVTRNR